MHNVHSSLVGCPRSHTVVVREMFGDVRRRLDSVHEAAWAPLLGGRPGGLVLLLALLGSALGGALARRYDPERELHVVPGEPGGQPTP